MKEEDMSLMRKAVVKTVVAGACLGVFGLAGQADAAPKYKATFYVAGMGGHFAKAEAVIDPAADKPIKVNSLTKIDIGERPDHPTHDARIDVNNRNQMFWSTYKIDKATGKTHVGLTDLKTGQIMMDVDVDVPKQATKTKSMYCASGQSWDYYMPISMSNKGYIDVFRKSDLKHTQRIFLEGTDADIKRPYKFFHGTNSPDMTKMFLTINEADIDHGKIIGKMHMVMLDMKAFVKGKVKVLKKGVAVGAERSTISFRQYFSPDGKFIINATGDRLFLIDAETLKVLDAELVGRLDQAHDAIFTPDGKYVIFTLRNKRVGIECEDPNNPKADEYLMDGTLQLYDVEARKIIGQQTSVCLTCHDAEGVEEHAILCGLDANWSDI
jgi:hypothetical protein